MIHSSRGFSIPPHTTSQSPFIFPLTPLAPLLGGWSKRRWEGPNIKADKTVGMDIGMPGLGGMRASDNNAANKGMAFEEENHCSSALYPKLAMS